MSAPLSAEWMTYLFQMPSIQQFIDSLIEQIADGRSMFIGLPDTLDPTTIWMHLQEGLYRREFLCAELLVENHTDPAQSFVNLLADSFEVAWENVDTARTLHNLRHGLAKQARAPNLIYLYGLDQTANWAEWLSLVLQWSNETKMLVDSGQLSRRKAFSALCVMVPMRCLPYLRNTELYLSMAWWWGIPSTLETQLLCRLAEQDSSTTSINRWREHVLPALANGDVGLIEYLWNFASELDGTGTLPMLKQFGIQRGWNYAQLTNWNLHEFQSAKIDYHPVQGAPDGWHAAWAAGMLTWTIEYGLEVHSAALATMDNRDALLHRLWRGQATLLLPLLDQARLTLCNYLTRRYGQDWPRYHSAGSPEADRAVTDNPMACEWGHLVLLLGCEPLRHERVWQSMAKGARDARNLIAHYEPVTFQVYETLMRDLTRLLLAN